MTLNLTIDLVVGIIGMVLGVIGLLYAIKTNFDTKKSNAYSGANLPPIPAKVAISSGLKLTPIPVES